MSGIGWWVFPVFRMRRMLLSLLCLFMLLGWAVPGLAQTEYWGPPYNGFPSLGEAVAHARVPYDAEVGQNPPYGLDCVHHSCVVVVEYYDPRTSGSRAAEVKLWYDGVEPNGGASISATSHSYDALKNIGGPSSCVCHGGEGSSAGGSSPNGSSGDSAQDSQPIGSNAVFESDPINAATGNKFQQDTDFRGSKWLTFRRFYNSIGYVTSTTFGAQWRHSFDRSLEISQFTGGARATVIDAYRPDGRREHFKWNDGSWVADADTPDTLIEHDDIEGNPTGYDLIIAGLHHTETYAINGLLQSVVDAAGQGITLAYSTASTPISTAPKPDLLLTVTDTQGRQLGFTYNSASTISTVTLPDGGVLTYGYDVATGNLVSVKYPDLKTRQYVYNESSLTGNGNLPHALTGVVDEAGIRFENTSYSYYSQGRAIGTSFSGGVDATSILTGSSSATLTTPLGAYVNFSFQNILGVIKPRSSGTPCGSQCNQSLQSRSYDVRGYPSSATDFKNEVTKTIYDANGLLNQKIEAFGTASQRTTNTTWDAALRMPLTRSVVDANHNTVAMDAWVYNIAGQPLVHCEIDPHVSAAASYSCSNSSTPPSGVRRWISTYCTMIDTTQCPLIGLLLSTDGPRIDASDKTSYTYYMDDTASHQHGDLKTVTDALGHITGYFTYDGAGRILTRQDSNGVVTTLTYTPRGWLASREVGGATTLMTYTPYGAVESITDPDGVEVTFGYDNAHRLITTTDGAGNYIRYTLDASGNRTKEQIYAGSGTVTTTVSRVFNKLGQLTKILDGLNHSVFDASASSNYDANGNLVHSVDALNSQRQQSYDALNRLTTTIANYDGTDPATRNSQTASDHDALDRLVGVSDPGGLDTFYTYDGLGNLTALKSPDSGNNSDTYDAAGNRLTHTDAKNVLSTSTYDALNQVTSTSYADSSLNVSYMYDEANAITGCPSSKPKGRLTRIIESGVTTVYCYSDRGRILQKRQITANQTDTTAYAYTLADRLSEISTPDQTIISYAYNPEGLLSSVQVYPSGSSAAPTTVASSITWMPFGPISGYTLGNGQHVTRIYDANYGMTDLTSPVLNLHFARDAMGNIKAVGNAPGADPATETYHYDALYRLKDVTQPDGSPIETYTYDLTGDRLSKTAPGLATGAYLYTSGTHQLNSVGNAQRTNDLNGNTTASIVGGGSFGFTYNNRNRLAIAQRNGNTVGTYTYNAMGERIGKVASFPQSVSERFAYNQSRQLIGEYGTSNRDYVWMGDIPVAVIDNTINGSVATSTVNYVIADQLGTPRAVTNGSGAAIWSWAYAGNPFGEQQPTSSTGYVLNLRYPGQYYDAESNTDYNVNRTYEPATGRYLQSDPTGLDGGISTYAYVDGNPLSDVDPLGLSGGGGGLRCIAGGVIGAVGSVALCSVTGPGEIVCAPAATVATLAMLGCAAGMATTPPSNVLPFPMTKPMGGSCPKDGDGDDRCEQNLNRDLASCKAVGKRGGKQAYEICRRQAIIRYGNCLSGRDSDIDAPLPPW